MDTADIILRAALVGIGGTIVLDLYAFLMQRMCPLLAQSGGLLHLTDLVAIGSTADMRRCHG